MHTGVPEEPEHAEFMESVLDVVEVTTVIVGDANAQRQDQELLGRGVSAAKREQSRKGEACHSAVQD